MHLKVIQQFSEMEALAGEWNALLNSSASHVPFLRYEYIRTWWETLGGGEWPYGEMHVVTARDGNGSLVGIAPLFYTINKENRPALMLMGSIEISDYLDLIVRPEHLPVFVDAMMDHLAAHRSSPAWQSLDLYNLLDSSPTLVALRAAAEKRGWGYAEEPLQKCPAILLPDDWEVYLSGIDKKQRHEIRRKIRRAEQHEIPVNWYVVGEASALEAEMEEFMRLMAHDPEKERFLTPEMRAQLKATARSAFDEGWLQLAFIEVGGEKAAAYMNFDFDNQIWIYNSGFDPRFRELSVGWVLLGYLIRWAIENGRQAFDFMRGNEDYKYRFGAIDRRIMRAVIRC